MKFEKKSQSIFHCQASHVKNIVFYTWCNSGGTIVSRTSVFSKENKWKQYILAREIYFELVHIHARFVLKKSNNVHHVKFKHKERSTNFCCIINSNSITFSRGKSKSVTLFQTFLLGRYAISGTTLESKITSTAIPPAVEPTTIATVATEQGL